MSTVAVSGKGLAVVTGGRRGIGAGIAVELARKGFNIAITDISEDGADSVLRAIETQGAKAAVFVSDLADVERHPEVIEDILRWGGPITSLVNNAGIPAAQRGDLLDVGADSFDRVLDVNLRGTFFFTQAVAKHMVATPSTAQRSIVTVSSVSAELASIERAEYCLSKAGLTMLTKLFALRLAPLGIAVFEVRPGVIRTPMTENVASAYERRIADGLVPMGRWGNVEDVAHVVSALVSGGFQFASGSVINVDGALSIQRL